MPFCANIFYRTYEGGARGFSFPIILLHGAGSTHMGWPFSLRHLPGQRVFALDLPAHGKSEGACYQSLTGLARHLHAFLQEMGLYRVILVSHSMGGALALTYAATYPGRVRGMILLGCGQTFHIPTTLLDTLRRPAKLEKALNFIQTNAFAVGFPHTLRREIIRPMYHIRPNILRTDLSMCVDFSPPPSLKKFPGPVSIIGGMEDVFTPPSSLRQLHCTLPDSRLTFLSAAGHMLIFEKTELIQKLMGGFLKIAAR